MKLDDIIASQPTRAIPERSDEEKAQEVEKLAGVLEALSEEDTLLDDLARAAVAFEVMEKHYGQKSNA
jgi:hypothetical protein